MSNKILYSPKEGTTGFWGLIGLAVGPTPDDFPDSEIGKAGYKVSLGHYESYLESCKEKKLELINPDVLPGYSGDLGEALTINNYSPGEIFDIPEGYNLVVASNGYTGKETKRWATLVKTELSQPEPEESQAFTKSDLESAFLSGYWLHLDSDNNDLATRKQKFEVFYTVLIQRKKQ